MQTLTSGQITHSARCLMVDTWYLTAVSFSISLTLEIVLNQWVQSHPKLSLFPWGSAHSMSDQCRVQKFRVFASMWYSSEGPSQLQSLLRNWLCPFSSCITARFLFLLYCPRSFTGVVLRVLFNKPPAQESPIRVCFPRLLHLRRIGLVKLILSSQKKLQTGERQS